MGMFINTLPLRLAQSEERVTESLRATQHMVGRALQHAHVPLYRIVAAGGVGRATSYSALFQTMFQANTVGRSMLEGAAGGIDEPRRVAQTHVRQALRSLELQP